MAISLSQDGAPPMLAVRNLSRIYHLGDETIHALDRVSVDIPVGQFIAIMGPSGSGKSTLLHLMGGLDRPDDGQIEVAGQQLDLLSGEDLAGYRRDMIGFIFQAFHLVPALTALENVALPGIFAGMSRDERELRAFDLLSAIGMAERLDHRPSQLSGGQQQRVAIARALFNDPPIIMADEPTGALDSKTGKTVMRLLRDLCEQQGKTIIVVTHDEVVAGYADRRLRLYDGRIVQDTLRGEPAPATAITDTMEAPIIMATDWKHVEDAIVEEADAYVEAE